MSEKTHAIQMVDLFGQFQSIETEILDGIKSVISRTAFINGAEVGELAKNLEKYNNVKHVIPCANGTDALQIAMMALDFKPGDEVIVPAFTYVATVEVIALLGLKPVFIDVKEDTFEMDCDLLEKVLTPKTVGIVTVHLYGQCSNMERILEFAKKYKLKVREDNAQAIGAEFKFPDGSVAKSGTIGDIGTTSFFPSKNLGCYGDGGAIFTNDNELAEKLKMIANHGQSIKYHHDSIGVNSRLDTIQAVILNAKLKHLDAYTKNRNIVADIYDSELTNHDFVITPVRSNQSTHVFHQYTLRVKGGKRDELKSFLEERGIPSMIYYPIPVHLQKAYLKYGYKEGDFPVAEKLCKEVLSLPIHTEMKDEDQRYIIDQIKDFGI
jgi:UDP-2-acetamido-2-deoxy-ribo-hexuluronate aminotransferase